MVLNKPFYAYKIDGSAATLHIAHHIHMLNNILVSLRQNTTIVECFEIEFLITVRRGHD